MRVFTEKSNLSGTIGDFVLFLGEAPPGEEDWREDLIAKLRTAPDGLVVLHTSGIPDKENIGHWTTWRTLAQRVAMAVLVYYDSSVDDPLYQFACGYDMGTNNLNGRLWIHVPFLVDDFTIRFCEYWHIPLHREPSTIIKKLEEIMGILGDEEE